MCVWGGVYVCVCGLCARGRVGWEYVRACVCVCVCEYARVCVWLCVGGVGVGGCGCAACVRIGVWRRYVCVCVGGGAMWVGGVLTKLQALVYDILPLTTAVFSYDIGSRKLSANEQFSIGTQII